MWMQPQSQAGAESKKNKRERSTAHRAPVFAGGDPTDGGCSTGDSSPVSLSSPTVSVSQRVPQILQDNGLECGVSVPNTVEWYSINFPRAAIQHFNVPVARSVT